MGIDATKKIIFFYPSVAFFFICSTDLMFIRCSFEGSKVKYALTL